MRFFFQQHNTQQGSKGYMLVEILVSMAIFTLIAVSTTAALLTIIDANSRAQSVKSVMDNLNVALENMSRTVRIGTNYHCINQPGETGYNNNTQCQAGTLGVAFIPQDAVNSSDWEYYYFKTATFNGIGYGGIFRTRNGVETAITAPEVNITYARFFLLGANVGDGQPRVLIVLNGNSGATTQASSFIIQTTITERQPDCDDASANACPK